MAKSNYSYIPHKEYEKILMDTHTFNDEELLDEMATLCARLQVTREEAKHLASLILDEVNGAISKYANP